jgi:predicted dehydrogenase
MIMKSRRDFLNRLVLPFVATPLLAAKCKTTGANESQDEVQQVLRVAIMGLGSYGTRVAEAMKDCKKAKLVGVISGTPSKIADWQSKYGIPAANCYNYENYGAIKNNADIDAVYVITPNALHKNAVIQLAKAGKHVVCEKPMGINAMECREMIEACRAARVKLLVGYRMHFEAKTLEIVRMRQSGELGKILYFQGLSGFRIGNPSQWRLNKALAGGGAMMDIGIYAVNGARYMVGEEPLWVAAQETKTDPVKFKAGVDETILFQLGFPSGAVASCLSTYNMNGLDKFFLNGLAGFAELHPATGYGPIKGRTSRGELSQPHRTHQTVQMEEMSDIILRGKQPMIPVDGEEGLKDLVVIDAIYEAVLSGKQVKLKME